MTRQAGLSLVELMIAMTLGFIVLGGTIAIYVITVGSSTDTLKSARLNYDLNSALALMANEIRRSGFYGGLVDVDFSTENPFMETDATDNVTTNLTILENGTCILYTYDSNSDGLIPIPTAEFFGFRLNGADLQMRLTGTTTHDCTDGTWQSLNLADGGDQIDITSLKFSFAPITESGVTLVPGQTKCIDKDNDLTYSSTCAAAGLTSSVNAAESRQVNIRLSGRVANDQSIIKTVMTTIKVRNDRIFVQP